MADLPISFSPAMVRALLASTKTQTRRVHHTQKPEFTPKCDHGCEPRLTRMCISTTCGKRSVTRTKISVGDRLYVREAWRTEADLNRTPPRDLPVNGPPIFFEADAGGDPAGATGKFRQGMHMPKWASRLTLIVTEVRVQRLQDISREDAIAEGIEAIPTGPSPDWRVYNPTPKPFGGEAPTVLSHGRGVATADPRHSYATLWDSLNEKRDDGALAWAANPWVVAYSFTVHRGNIFQIGSSND